MMQSSRFAMPYAAHAQAKAADKAAFGGFLERAAGTRTEL